MEDCDEPKLIETLAGLRVISISAGGWHSAVVTDQVNIFTFYFFSQILINALSDDFLFQGDLYTWGWNKHGDLGHPQVQNISAVPTIVDFYEDHGKTVELNIVKAQCGNNFTICRTGRDFFIVIRKKNN